MQEMLQCKLLNEPTVLNGAGVDAAIIEKKLK
jgi:hypothetical protein